MVALRHGASHSSRILPGDGVAPDGQILPDLHRSRCRWFLSLELFNREYRQRSADENLATAMSKMRAPVQQAFA